MSEKIHDFDQSVQLGEFGEAKIAKWIKQLPEFSNLLDVSKIDKYQEKDIDFILYLINGSRIKLEIKTDSYTSGNLFFETLSNIEYNVLGCMLKTKADLILYYFTKYNKLYILKRERFVEWAMQGIKKGKYKRKTFANKRKNKTLPPTHTEGYPIPLAEIEEQSFCKVVENFN